MRTKRLPSKALKASNDCPKLEVSTLDADRTRFPAVAGLFYPLDKDDLFESIHRCFTNHLGPGSFPQSGDFGRIETNRVECLIVPHAGYEFSGPVAAHSYYVANSFFQSSSEDAATVIILGPNHYGIGSGVALSRADRWMTPLGNAKVNSDISKKLTKMCDILDFDDLSHSKEHSIEVQLPFLQSVSRNKQNWSIVPISMMLQDIDTSKELAKAIFKLVNSSTGNFLLIASSDFTHYERQEEARKKDLKLLEQIKNLDLSSFYSVLERLSVTACGYGAMATLMQVAKDLGRQEGVILKYSTSGDVTNDMSSVVGYSSVRFI